MTDLVQRLMTDPPKHKPVIEAAREIERLTAERDMLADFAKECILGAYRPSELPHAAREVLNRVRK